MSRRRSRGCTALGKNADFKLKSWGECGYTQWVTNLQAGS